MSSPSESPVVKETKEYTGGAVGAGIVLIVIPCVALYLGINTIGREPTVGLPILAIFGIMILFGALALVSTLFARLGLADSSQALALPEGSIRAAIALSLIVLFAIISIMLNQSASPIYVIPGLGSAERDAIVKDASTHVVAVASECRPAGAKNPTSLEGCAPGDVRYAVHVGRLPSQASTDLAKQLLILIGTLMTSVVSFYFGSRASELKRDDKAPGDGSADEGTKAAISSAGQNATEENIDGCDVAVVHATADEDLPAARGGEA